VLTPSVLVEGQLLLVTATVFGTAEEGKLGPKASCTYLLHQAKVLRRDLAKHDVLDALKRLHSSRWGGTCSDQLPTTAAVSDH